MSHQYIDAKDTNKKKLTHIWSCVWQNKLSKLILQRKSCSFSLNRDYKLFISVSISQERKKKSRDIKVVCLIREKCIMVVYRKN